MATFRLLYNKRESVSISTFSQRVAHNQCDVKAHSYCKSAPEEALAENPLLAWKASLKDRAQSLFDNVTSVSDRG